MFFAVTLDMGWPLRGSSGVRPPVALDELSGPDMSGYFSVSSTSPPPPIAFVTDLHHVCTCSLYHTVALGYVLGIFPHPEAFRCEEKCKYIDPKPPNAFASMTSAEKYCCSWHAKHSSVSYRSLQCNTVRLVCIPLSQWDTYHAGSSLSQ